MPRDNLAACRLGLVNGRRVGPGHVMTWESRYVIPRLGLCDCGRELELEGFTNTCDCGADYNWAGQLLAPRACWGEETGETAADILMEARR